MQFSTASKKETKNSSVSLLVSLFLILLTIFILLSNGSSYDPNKQKAVKTSVEDIFGKSNKQNIIFGRLEHLKIDDYALELNKVVKDYASVVINNDQDKLRLTIPMDKLYYSDEANFKNTAVNDMIQIMNILKNWADTETIHIGVYLSETNFEQDEERLEFFRKYIQGKRPLIGLKTKNDQNMDIIVERAL